MRCPEKHNCSDVVVDSAEKVIIMGVDKSLFKLSTLTIQGQYLLHNQSPHAMCNEHCRNLQLISFESSTNISILVMLVQVFQQLLSEFFNSKSAPSVKNGGKACVVAERIYADFLKALHTI
jgi:hypothetical protein